MNRRFLIVVVLLGALFSAGAVRGLRKPASAPPEVALQELAHFLPGRSKSGRNADDRLFSSRMRVNGIASTMSAHRRLVSQAVAAQQIRRELAAKSYVTTVADGPGCRTVVGIDKRSGELHVSNVYADPSGRGAFVLPITLDSRDVKEVRLPGELAIPHGMTSDLTIESEDTGTRSTTVSGRWPGRMGSCRSHVRTHLEGRGWNIEEIASVDDSTARYFLATRGTSELMVSMWNSEDSSETQVLLALSSR